MRPAETKDRAERSGRERGERVAQARREAGLNQKTLAEQLGVSLWSIEQLERGRGDSDGHLAQIAKATRKPRAWFEVHGVGEQAVHGPVAKSRRAARAVGAHHLILGSITLLVVIRFFTEIVPLLPRAANFVDIPVLVALAVAAATLLRNRPGTATGANPFTTPAFLFIGLAVASAILNPSRVEPGPVLVFLYGFLAPIGVYSAVYRLWPAGRALSLSRVLVALGILQLAVVFAIDLPRFLSTSDPDVISGTFGTNAYQLVFFLLMFTGLLAGIFTLEKRRLTARFAPLLFVLILATIFLAQYRALLVSTAVTVLLLAALLSGKARGLVTSAVVAVSFVATLSYVASHFPILRLAPTLTTFQSNPTYYPSQRLRAVDNVVNVYSNNPLFILTGTGPGTFSSRAWQTFAFANSKSGSNVQGSYVSLLGGGRVYHTNVSDKYILPQLRSAPTIGGSRAVASPFSSYTSLLAEVGIFGFLLLAGVYVRATVRALRMAVHALRRSVPGDPLPGLLLACVVAFTVLIQMGFLENWFEVTRVTFIAWALLAVATKEFDARDREGS